jgi:hypothetical protein
MKNYVIAAFLPAALVSAMACASAAQSLSTPNSSTNSGAIPQGATLVAELAKSIDTKKARPGDPVKAKIVQDVISNGQIVIHRGSKLLGHITEARAFNPEAPPCVLGVVFDHVTLKHGEELNLNAVLQALAPPVLQPDPLASSNYDGSKGSGSQPVSGRDGGWMIDPRDRRDHTRDDALRNAQNPNTYGSANNTLHNGLLGNGNRGVFGMPGVSLKSAAPAPELVSTKADIKLEDGTQMVLGVTGSR